MLCERHDNQGGTAFERPCCPNGQQGLFLQNHECFCITLVLFKKSIDCIRENTGEEYERNQNFRYQHAEFERGQ